MPFALRGAGAGPVSGVTGPRPASGPTSRHRTACRSLSCARA